MWEWFSNNAVWILIGSSLLVILLLFYSDKVRRLISSIEPKGGVEKFNSNINIIFWTIEALAVALMIFSFIIMSTGGPPEAGPLITREDVERWFLEHGIRVILILIVGFVLWVIFRQMVPPLIERVMGRPQPGEDLEGVKKRALTLRGVFLGVGRVVIILLIIFMVLSELNISIGPILAGFGIAGIAVGFGAQYLIRDLIAGIFILMENQYRVGDVVGVAGVTGLVEEINLRKTVLRDQDGVVHHVPNGEIRVASNYTRHFSRVNLNIAVAYSTDLDRAIEVINRVCEEMAAEERWAAVFRKVPRVLRVDKLGDSGIEIKIVGEVKPAEQWNVMGELRLRLKRRFDREGIEIPWPHVKVYFGDRPKQA